MHALIDIPKGLHARAYIVSHGNITATIIWFAITTGVTAGLSYYNKKQ
jgi:hypothetical protein